MFTANRDNGYFMRKAKERGFTCRNQLAIIKKNPLPQYKRNNWRNAYELCMYLTKGRAGTFNFLSQRDCVNTYQYVIGRKHSKHPTEKPLGFIKKLIQVSSKPGDIVLDPFMGSGTTAVACKELGRHCIGAETSSDYIKMIDKRLTRAKNIHYSDGLATEKQKALMKKLVIEFENSITKKTAFERIRQKLHAVYDTGCKRYQKQISN
jgi:DNA modification methylase